MLQRKEVCPLPLPVDPFLFRHLLDEAQEEKEKEGETASLLSHCLWEHYSPQTMKTLVEESRLEEKSRTHQLADMVDQMWRGVEGIQQINQKRRAMREEGGQLEAQLAEVEHFSFWKDGAISRRFGIETVEETQQKGEESATRVDSAEKDADRIRFNFSTESSPRPAKALHMTEEELLDPTLRPQCLRRLFTPLLQKKRESLPKELTIFLEELRTMQTVHLPSLEEAMVRNLLFHVPLHRPLSTIVSFIHSNMTTVRETAQIEEGAVLAFRLLEKKIEAFYDQVEEWVRQAGSGGTQEEEEEELLQILGELWRRLFEDVEEHRQFHVEVWDLQERLAKTGAEVSGRAQTAWKACEEKLQKTFAALEKDGERCAAQITAVGETTLRVVDEAEQYYHRDIERLRQSITSKSYLLEKSEKQQEKLCRRLREVAKELYGEQVAYARMSEEWVEEKTRLAQLEACYGQLRGALDTRYQAAQEADKSALELRALIQQGKQTCSMLMASCQAHLGRLEHDDHFRRCRLSRELAQNIQWWKCRVTDIESLYQQRYTTAAQKSALSWQIEYLIAGELDWCRENLEDAAESLQEVEEEGQRVAELEKALELEPFQTDPETFARQAALREKLLSLDTNRQLHRNILTWKAFKRNQTLPIVVRGSGSTAARRLSTKEKRAMPSTVSIMSPD